MYPEILLVRQGTALPPRYTPIAERMGWTLAASGQPQTASAGDSRAVIVGDPVLRRGVPAEAAARFLESAERGEGESFLVDRLMGNYVLCHADRGQIRIHASAAGLHHLFYHPTWGASTSLRDLSSLAAPEFDPVSVYQFLSAGYTFGTRTVLSGVYRLLGGEGIRTDGRRLDRRRWYPLSFPRQTLSTDALLDYIRTPFAECRQSLEAAGTLCADVTGGFDTRLVVAMLHHLGIPFRGWVSGGDGDRDVVLAKVIGDRLGFPVHQVDVERMEGAVAAFGLEQFGGQAFLKPFHAWLDMMFANLQCTECDGLRLSGHGGEQFRDFAWQQEFPFFGLHRPPHIDLQIRLRFLGTQASPRLMNGDLVRTIRDDSHRRVRDDMRAFVAEIDPPDNLAACLALYLVFREGARVGSSATEKRRSAPNWAPWLEPEVWLRSARTSWFSRLGAGLSLELAERLAPALEGIPTTAMGHRARGVAAVLPAVGHYAQRGAAKLMQKASNRPYASGRARTLPALRSLLRTPRFQELVMASIEPCHLDPARIEAALREPEASGNAELLGSLIPLGQLAKDRSALVGAA